MTSSRTLLIGIAALLIFAPLAFGSVEPWAVAVLECGVFILALLYFISLVLKTGKSHGPFPWVIVALGGSALCWGALLWTGGYSVSPGDTRDALVLGAAYLVFFPLTAAAVGTRDRAEGFVQILMFLGFAVALIAILQFYSWNGKIYWLRSTARPMVYGPFVNRNHLAGFLEMLIPLGAGYLAGQLTGLTPHGDTLWRRLINRITRPESTRLLLIFFTLLVMGVALLLTLSRGGIVAFVSSMTLLGVLLSWRRGRRRRGLIPVALVGGILLSLTWFGIGPLVDRLSTLRNAENDPSVILRSAVWGDTLRMAGDTPWTGTGAGTFEKAFPPYKSFPNQLLFAHAHNDYLEWLSDNGVVGTAVAAAALVWIAAVGIRGLLRRRHPAVRGMLAGALAGALALMIHSASDFNLHIPSNALLFTALLSLAWTLSHTGGPEEPRARSTGMRTRVAAGFGAAAACWLLWVSLSAGIADYHYRAGLRAEGSGDEAGAYESYRLATEWDGANACYSFRRARLEEGRWLKTRDAKRLESARADLDRAVRLSPTVAEYHLHLGWIDAMRGRREAATAEFQKVLDLDPTNAEWQHYIGLWYAGIGDGAGVDARAAALRKLGFEGRARAIEQQFADRGR